MSALKGSILRAKKEHQSQNQPVMYSSKNRSINLDFVLEINSTFPKYDAFAVRVDGPLSRA